MNIFTTRFLLPDGNRGLNPLGRLTNKPYISSI